MKNCIGKRMSRMKFAMCFDDGMARMGISFSQQPSVRENVSGVLMIIPLSYWEKG